MIPVLHARCKSGGIVRQEGGGVWRLEIPAGDAQSYRWAQLDDYLELPRRKFPWRLHAADSTLRFELRARVSAPDLPGTWGFGLWNDPFNASLGIGGTVTRLPALPNAAWFFYAAPPNHLAFRDTHPAQGFLAATFASKRIPTPLLAPGALGLPLLALRPAVRLVRRAIGWLVNESGALIPGDPRNWRTYRLDWSAWRVAFYVDGVLVSETSASPPGPLGLVIWIDNQFAAFPPTGKFAMGLSPNPQPAWLEVADINVSD